MKYKQIYNTMIAILLLGFSISMNSDSKKPWIAFDVDGKYGFKTNSGKIILKPKFDMAFDFTKKDVTFVFTEGKWICINSKFENLLSPFNFDNGPDEYSEKLARFVENNKMGFFDDACKIKIPADYDFASSFEDGTSIVCNGCYREYEGEHYRIVGGKYGAIDKRGKIILPVEYDKIESINLKKKIATVKKDNQSISIKLR